MKKDSALNCSHHCTSEVILHPISQNALVTNIKPIVDCANVINEKRPLPLRHTSTIATRIEID